MLRNMNRWMMNRYGSRRGCVRTYWHRLRYFLGAYHEYSDIDWKSVERLVFVCKGNICRSAYAEVVARAIGVDAVSCGLDTIEDAPANADAIRAACREGVNLEGHITQPVMYLALKKNDLIITMEPWQSAYLKKHLVRVHSITLLGIWSETALPHLQDPYNATDEYFDKCFANIKNGVQSVVGNMKA